MTKSFGPYSIIRQAGDMVFVSGQVGISDDGKTVPPDITSQTKNVLTNIKNILASEKLSMDNVVKATVFLTNMDNLAIMNDEYLKHFPNIRPARSAVAVRELPRVGGDIPILIEIEVVAMKDSK